MTNTFGKVEMSRDESIRVIQYLGSKMRIIENISNEIERITPRGGTVADVFSGSGVVAFELAKKFRVYANDVQSYCKTINEALLRDVSKSVIPSLNDLRNSKAYSDNRKYLEKVFKTPLEKERRILTEQDVDQLVKISQFGIFYDKTSMDIGYEKYNREYFGDAYVLFDLDRIRAARKNGEHILFCLYYLNSYFSLEQCVEIDSLKAAIDSLSNNKVVKNVLTTCLMHAVSEVVCTVGKNYAQPMKLVDGKGNVKSFSVNRCFRDRTMDLTSPFDKMYNQLLTKDKVVSDDNMTFNNDVLSFLDAISPGEVNTFYLDPPYTIDHYSRFYHVLETLVLYDYPELEKKVIGGHKVLLNGRYRTGRYQSNFCIPSKSVDEFTKMIKSIRKKEGNIVMSYSDSQDNLDTRKRVVSLNELTNVLKDSYEQVEMIRIDHRYRKLSDKESLREEMKDGEILFVCQC